MEWYYHYLLKIVPKIKINKQVTISLITINNIKWLKMFTNNTNIKWLKMFTNNTNIKWLKMFTNIGIMKPIWNISRSPLCKIYFV